MKPDPHEVVEAAADYVWSSVGLGYRVPLEAALADRLPLLDDVRTLIHAYREGQRLTPHRSGYGYEVMRAKFVGLPGKT